MQWVQNESETNYQITTFTLSPSFVRRKAHSVNNAINEESAFESITNNNNNNSLEKEYNNTPKEKKKKKKKKEKGSTHKSTRVTSSPPLDGFDGKSSIQ
jgi:hypothetical protein